MKQKTQFHLSRSVCELGVSQEFYTGVLGCKLVRDERDWVDLDFFGHQLTLHGSPKPDAEHSTSHFGANLQPSDWQELRNRLCSAGVAMRDSGERKFIVEDPDGVGLEFKQLRSKPSGIEIRRRLALGDIGEIARLHGVIYGAERGHGVAFEAYVAQGLAEYFQRFDPAADRLWLCTDGDRIVGTLFLMHCDGSAQLRYFLVLPEYRGLGLGKSLMHRFMASLDELDYKHSFLWTTNELAAAASLYMRNGFDLVEEKASTRFGKALIEQRYDWFRDR